MKDIRESKRRKYTGRGAPQQYLGIAKWIINTKEFAGIKGSPLKLLIDMAAQYNGYNNGNLTIAEANHRWSSRSKLTRAEKWLIDHDWIVKTRMGGLGMGPNLYAVTWWPIDDCKGKHHHRAETVASHAWMKTRRLDPNQVKSCPESGQAHCPQPSSTPSVRPESGQENGVFRAA